MSGKSNYCDICTYSEDNEALFGKILSKLGIQAHTYCLLSSIIPQNGTKTLN